MHTEPARDRKSFSLHLGSDASLIRVSDTRPDSDAFSRTGMLANLGNSDIAGYRPSKSAWCKLARVDRRTMPIAARRQRATRGRRRHRRSGSRVIRASDDELSFVREFIGRTI
jgi:hypothetical protein